MSRYTVSQAVDMLDELTELGKSETEESDTELVENDNEDVNITVFISNDDDVPTDCVVIEPATITEDENNNVKVTDSNETSLTDDNEINENISIECDVTDPEIISIDESNLNISNAIESSSSDETNTVGENTPDENDTAVKRGRKRIRNEEEWKENKRKRLRQSGKEYVNVKGKAMRTREVRTKKDCQGKCKYRCSVVLSQTDRKQIFDEFWSLNDSEKCTFYSNTTEKIVKERQRTDNEKSRRKYTYKYYLRKGTDRYRVCKEFYESTLDISGRRVEYFHKKVEEGKGHKDKRGTARIQKIPEVAKVYIRDHIKSFPKVPSHYCRSSTSKGYLDPSLNVSEMHRLYVEKCTEDNIAPQTYNAYYNIFTYEFNLGFLSPKKDRCDICEEYKIDNQRTPILQTKYDAHIKDKILTTAARTDDRECTDENVITICFDMENCILCPRSNVSNFFYKRKLSVFNMTGHCSRDKMAYNVIWNEQLGGRGANEIASAVTIILENVIEEHPETKKIILWSDSCVPQNRNSIMCYAIKLFQQNHPEVTEIVQKFGTPGHSSIQEIDNIHSHIEKKLKVSDIYSPLSLIRTLKTVRKHAMTIIQMKAESDEFLDFQSMSSNFMFKGVPFFKVKALKYMSCMPFHAFYKTSFDSEFVEESIIKKTRAASGNIVVLPDAKPLNSKPVMSAEKKKDIESMLKFMPTADRIFMEKLCKVKGKK